MKLLDVINSGGVYTIAEMSANHAGKLENALAIIRAAKEAGADCLKIQTYTADTITLNCDNEYFKIKGGLWDGYNMYQLYQEAGTPWEWQREIKEECERLGLDFLSTPFDATSVDFLENLGVEAYKIASFELTDIPLIKYVASKQKPMIVSCGLASAEEIQEMLDAAHEMGNEQVFLLKCTSEYPARFEDMNLSLIKDMQERFGTRVGLSDHSMGYLAPVVAVSLGACIVEKHFCLDRMIKNPDSAFSMEPDEFAEMVKNVKLVKASMGKPTYEHSEEELSQRHFRRSLFAGCAIKAGEKFTEKNVRCVRPSVGMAPSRYWEVLEHKASQDIPFGTPLRDEHLG